MFDVSFGELVLIGIVALLVLGPERLPKVARTAGLWAGKARQFIATVKADIEQELKAEELRRLMQDQAKSSGVHEIIEETKESLEQAKQSLNEVKGNLNEVKGNLEEVKGDLDEAVKQEHQPKAAPAPTPSSSSAVQPSSSPSGADHDHRA